MIAVYIAKPFVDAFLKRAAEETTDVTYPAVKQAIVKLVRKVFVREPIRLTVVSTSPLKVQDPTSLLFAMHATSKTGQHIKFVFRGGLTEAEYDFSIEQLFAMLQSHYEVVSSDDDLSPQMAALSRPNDRHIYVVYSPQTGWATADIRSSRDNKE